MIPTVTKRITLAAVVGEPLGDAFGAAGGEVVASPEAGVEVAAAGSVTADRVRAEPAAGGYRVDEANDGCWRHKAKIS